MSSMIIVLNKSHFFTTFMTTLLFLLFLSDKHISKLETALAGLTKLIPIIKAQGKHKNTTQK